MKAIDTGQPVRIGFLLGTRDFKSWISRFQVGDRLAITANSVFNDGQIGGVRLLPLSVIPRSA